MSTEQQIECPCCKGSGRLWLWDATDEEAADPPSFVRCCHCNSLGYVLEDNRSNNPDE